MGRRLFYGWVVVAVTSIVVVIVAGVRSAPGAFLLSMTQEPGWSTASVSFVAAVGLVVFGLAGPLSGWLMGAAFVAAGWIAIIAGFAALAIRRERPDAPGEPGLPTRPAEAGA